MDDQKRYFNIAGELFLALCRAGQTNVFKYINKQYDRIIRKAASFDLFSSTKKASDYICEIDNQDYENSLVFLVALDNYSKDNSQLVEYVKSSRTLNKNLAEIDGVLIYPTYEGVEHFNKADDCFQSLFKNLYFINTDIFNHLDYSIDNYYFDDIPYCKEINIIFIPYPIEDEISKRNVEGFIQEKKKLSESDNTFIKRIEHIIQNIDLSIPTIFFSPELVGNKALNYSLKTIMQRNRNIKCFISPSFHQVINGENYNQSNSLVIEDMAIKTCFIRKSVAATLPDGLIEKINESSFKTIVLHIKGIGRITIVICRDYLSEMYKQLIMYMLPSVVIVQCYNKSWRSFKATSQNFSTHNICCLIGNACSAANDSNEHKLLLIGKYLEYKCNEMTEAKFYEKECNEKCSVKCKNNYSCNIALELSRIDYDNNDFHPCNYLSINVREDL